MALPKYSVVLESVDRSPTSGYLILVQVTAGFFVNGYLLKKSFHGNEEKQRSILAHYLPFDMFQIVTPKTSPAKGQAAEGRQAAKTGLMGS